MSGDLVVTCLRRNLVQAAYVDAALTICKELGSRRAENFLLAQGVPMKVIQRVLLSNGPVRHRALNRELRDATIRYWAERISYS